MTSHVQEQARDLFQYNWQETTLLAGPLKKKIKGKRQKKWFWPHDDHLWKEENNCRKIKERQQVTKILLLDNTWWYPFSRYHYPCCMPSLFFYICLVLNFCHFDFWRFSKLLVLGYLCFMGIIVYMDEIFMMKQERIFFFFFFGCIFLCER